MKKFLHVLCILGMMTFVSKAQVIENFENFIKVHTMANGHLDVPSAFKVVANPLKGDANNSDHVMMFTRGFDGNPWAGFWSALSVPVDLTADKYIRVKVLKPRISPLHFKVEGGSSDPSFFEIPPVNEQTKTDEWETIVFYFENATGTYPTIVFMPDFEDPVTLTDDIVIYFDDIEVCNTPDGPATRVIENFEGAIPIHTMANGHLDVPEAFEVVANPLKDEVNGSDLVMKFTRAFDGNPWAGFWCILPQPIDMTVNKYMHVKVLKPRISPLHFKVEGGSTPNIEIPSMHPQTVTDAWEDLVFYFENATGTYPTIVFMPDFEDPVTLTEDITIYFDDIELTETGPVGVKNVSAGSGMVIYPNPVKTTLTLDNLQNAERIVISNLIGQQIMTKNNARENRITMDVSSLSRGIYLISIYSKDGKTETGKFMKE